MAPQQRFFDREFYFNRLDQVLSQPLQCRATRVAIDEHQAVAIANDDDGTLLTVFQD
jgi:hypothetical protein